LRVRHAECRACSADFQVCRVAGFQARGDSEIPRFADLEIGVTAGLETCATSGADSTENVEEPEQLKQQPKRTREFEILTIIMKKNSTLLGGALVALLAAGLQAYAQDDPTFQESLSVNANYWDNPITLNFTTAQLKSISTAPPAVGTVFSDTAYSIYGGDLYLTISDLRYDPVYLTIDNSQTTLYGNGSSDSQTVDFSLNSTQWGYIQSQNGQFSASVTLDCTLTSEQLDVYANTDHAPDGGSTVMLLGGVLTALGLMKRKMMA